MSAQGGRFRKKKVNFSMVSNSIIRDESISLKAKGLYALIQSYITLDDFTLYKSFLQRKCIEGERAFDSAWKELKEKGYLVQYKIRQGARTFYYEYELLDEPVSVGAHGVGVQNVGVENVSIQDEDVHDVSPTNRSVINNNPDIDIGQSNIKSVHILSAADVERQIDYQTLIAYKEDMRQVDEIVMLMVDVYNMPDGKSIRIAKNDLPSGVVKERMRMLNMMHIQYVLQSLKDNTNRISNIKAYLLTTLYNAPSTISTYYQNAVNADLYG